MSGYQFTPQASGDLWEIWSFIALDNPVAADRVEAAISRACDFIAGAPLAGQSPTRLNFLASSLLGGAALFELPRCLRPQNESHASDPDYSRCQKSSLDPCLGHWLSPRRRPKRLAPRGFHSNRTLEK